METPTIYRLFLAMRSEIDRHKWIESEKRGKDVGYEWAMIDWVMNHKKNWLKAYLHNSGSEIHLTSH